MYNFSLMDERPLTPVLDLWHFLQALPLSTLGPLESLLECTYIKPLLDIDAFLYSLCYTLSCPQGGDWTFGASMIVSRRDHACLYVEFERSRGVLVTGARDEVRFEEKLFEEKDCQGPCFC